MRGRNLLVAAAVTCGVAACARRAAVPLPAPSLPPLAPPPGLTVSLVWNAPVDLDLYLTDPTSETVYFANTPSRTGARLVRDARCPDLTMADAPFVEVANMPEPLPGRYRVGVDFIDACAAPAAAVSFRVAVDYGDTRRETIGTVELAHFQPKVLEFELQRSQVDGTAGGAMDLSAPLQED